MPNMDRTGPQGLGSLTGRGLGVCGNGIPRGCGRGFGRGFGVGRRYPIQTSLTKAEEKKILEADLKEIEAEKREVERRLSEIK